MHFDVAIIGGGPAGSACAGLLAGAKRSVALIERSDYCGTRIGETLPPRARQMLGAVGVTALHQDGHVPAPGIVTAWGSAVTQSNDFLANPYGNGWHLDRTRFDRMLAARSRAAGATVYEATAVSRCEAIEGGWQIALRDGACDGALTCRFVIDASGRHDTDIKRHAGRRALHDKLIGIAAFASRGAIEDRRTLIEASPRGWWYSSLLPDDRHVTVYMTDADTIDLRQSHRLESLQREITDAPLTHARWKTLGSVLEVTASAAMTSRQTLVRGSNWLLAGDAAMTWDPLSGQGVCKALESGIRAADAIDRALDGDARGLDAYGRWTDASFDDYLKTRSMYYRAEQRWPASPFWQRRHAAS